MPRYSRPPLTLEEMWRPGPPVRVRDLMHITGWSRPTILKSVDAGELVPIRRTFGRLAQYFFERHQVRAWLERAGFDVMFHGEQAGKTVRT